MLDEKAFNEMRQELETADEKRETVIKDSRPILKNAKRAIYLGHQGDVEQAQAVLEEARAGLEKLKQENQDAAHTGAFGQAEEEYVEAALFIAFITEQSLPDKNQLLVSSESYLGGVSDLTGELGRRAVFKARDRDAKEVERIRVVADMIQGEMLKFHLRNGNLRKKYDSIKYNLRKIEEVQYELSLRT